MLNNKIGRVHWFLWHLSPDVLRSYKLSFNYDRHSYCLYRNHYSKLIDVFIVSRTSKRCFRVMYCNFEKAEFIYKSFSNSRLLADFIEFVAFRPP